MMTLLDGQLGFRRESSLDSNDPAELEALTSTDMTSSSSQQETITKDDYDGDVEDDTDTDSNIQPTIASRISLARTYALCIALGFLGAHYYYLGMRTKGLLYTATLGFFGIGWLIDWFRLPSIVESVRRIRREEAENGYVLYAVPFGELEERSLMNAYLYAIPPWGLFGMHHMYLGTFRKNDAFSLLYTATLGFIGFGWLFDLFRIPILVRRANEDIRDLRSGKPVSSSPACTLHLDTAYSLVFPLGFFGLHHFYMRRYFYGFAYLFTFGMAGVGVLVDILRLPVIFKRTKTELKDLRFSLYHLDDTYFLWFTPLGPFGLHHFYLRNWKMGVAYLFTCGFLGVGWLIDAFRMRSLVEESNIKLDTDLLWDHHFVKEAKSKGNMNIFIDSKLFNYPITDEDSNIQVYAFPLRPSGKPSWLLGWAWSPTSSDPPLANQNGFTTSEEEPSQTETRNKTPLVGETLEGAVGWTIDTHENYEVTIA
ncbi:uncharacterized protein LOC135154915 [Lytechinus pictus]|uniref:uncharacterized protein LOC135154915 n=1 Tax=Lytechinus pictus TaxID=7653 RepID=UPI0030BA0FD2